MDNKEAIARIRINKLGLTRNPEDCEISWVPDENLGNGGL